MCLPGIKPLAEKTIFSFILHMGKISGSEVNVFWYNPKNGETKEAGRFPNKGQQDFVAPSSGYGQDWVLVIDDGSKNYALPK